ncbi:IS630 family transposase [Deinococcus sp. Arct2-2]|uniref:IS630 family transposase n=1 Tax=Deinococcus sp. Arct2-2 TaxID=2568653 RepID=UPI001F102C2C|nr:IS630 family transposase [Deinococcus sp. Arct2-2]
MCLKQPLDSRSVSRQWIGSSAAITSPTKKTLVARERSEERRMVFLNDLQPYLDHPERLIFVDESGFNTSMTRGYARAPSNQRAVSVVPRNHGKNDTLICALGSAGPLAPLILDGPVTAVSFEYYVQHELCPALTRDQVVIMDNLSSHHRASIRTLIEDRGCTLLFLPSYSPDFDPIEWLFSQVKGVLRGDARRSVDRLIEGIVTP